MSPMPPATLRRAARVAKGVGCILPVAILFLSTVTLVSHVGQAASVGPVARLPVTRVVARTNLTTTAAEVAYYVEVGFGTPPQVSRLVLDTGSTAIAVNTPGCASCNTTAGAGYNATASSSSVSVPCGAACPTGRCVTIAGLGDCCELAEAFVDGTGWSAALYDDVVTVANAGVNASFGAIMSSTMRQAAGVDGIIGFAFPAMSATGATWASDWAASTGSPAQFGLCLGDKGGLLTLGGDDASLHVGGALPRARVTQRGYWSLNVTGLRLRSSLLPGAVEVPIAVDAPRGGDVIDSGTATLLLAKSTHPRVVAGIRAMCARLPAGAAWPGLCDGDAWTKGWFAASDAAVATMPAIEFVFEGVDGGEVVASVDARRWLTPMEGFPGSWIVSVYASREETFVLGDPLFRSVYVLHDMDAMSVGFAPPAGECLGFDGGADAR